MSDLEEFKTSTIEHLIYIDGDQQEGMFRRNGLKIRTHLAKHFLSDKYLNYIPEPSKEILKETTNKLNTANGINNGVTNGNSNGSTLNGSTINGSINGNVMNGNLTNGTMNGLTNGNALMNGHTLNGHNLENFDENEKPKLLNGTTTNQKTKKQRLQVENADDKVSVIDKLNIYVDSDSPCALFFTSVSVL